MRVEDVTEIVSGLQAEGITVWLDGGGCDVRALHEEFGFPVPRSHRS